MRYLRTGLAAMTVFSILLPSSSFSDVKIMMKNGRTVVADSCSEANGRLLCTMEAGTFEIEKKDVGTVKDTAGKRQIRPPEAEEGEGASEEGASGEKQASEGEKAEQAEVDGSNPEMQKRLEDISQRKKELVSVREGMQQQRETLNREFNSQGDMIKPDVFDSFQRRFNEMDRQISGFNEEVKRLTAEEQALSQEKNRNLENRK